MARYMYSAGVFDTMTSTFEAILFFEPVSETVS